MAEYVQKFPGKINVVGMDSSEPVTAPQFNGALNGNATTATNADAATAVPATLVPSNTDINTYRGENYWGKTFYAGGNNTVQNTPIAGIAFSLEVLRSGAFATTQRITMLAVGSNNQPTVYTRSVSDSTTTSADSTWTAWTEVAEAQGEYPSMGAGKFIGTRVAENTDLNSLIPSSSNTALHYYCDSIAAAQTFENCPVEAPFNMIAFAPQASGGRYSQILFAISMPEMIFSRYCNNNSWSAWRQYATTDGTYPDMTVGGAEYLSRRAKINNTSSSANRGWYKIGTISVENFYGGGGYDTYSCVMLINGLNAGQYDTSGAASESGTIEIDVRREDTTTNFSNAGVSVLSGNVISNSVAVVRTSELVTLYYRLPTGFESAEFVILSENTKNEANICPSIFQFDTEYYGSTAPSGAVYAQVRNNASGDANGNSLMSHAARNELLNGTASYDFNDYIEWGHYELQGVSGTSLVNAPTSTSNPSATNADWYLDVYRRDSTCVTQIAYSARSDGAIAIRVLSNNSWGSWRVVIDSGTVPNATNATHATTAAMANTLAESGHKTLLWSGVLSNGERLNKSLFDEYSVLLFKDNTGAYWIAEFGECLNSGSFGQIKTTMVTSAHIHMTLCVLTPAGSSEYSLTFAKYEYSISNGSITGSPEVLDRWLTNIWGLEAFRIENG